MNDWKIISSNFFFLITITTLIALANWGLGVLYVCGKADWLEWVEKGIYPTIIGLLLLIGFPWWLGTNCTTCFPRNVFMFGALLNFGVVIISNIFSTLQWFLFLKICKSNIYATAGGWQVIVITWLVLPIGAVLGGAAAWLGYKWSKSNLDKKDRTDKK